MRVFAVRQKSTGFYIPILERGYRRGGSRSEPTNTKPPRIFPSRASARSYLGTWLQGIFETTFRIDYDGNEDYGLKVIPQPHRKKDDMEIVEFDLIECSNEQNKITQAA